MHGDPEARSGPHGDPVHGPEGKGGVTHCGVPTPSAHLNTTIPPVSGPKSGPFHLHLVPSLHTCQAYERLRERLEN